MPTCSGTQKKYASLLFFPSWWAASLHSNTDIMQPGLVPGLFTHRVFELLCIYTLCGRAHSAYQIYCSGTKKHIAGLSCFSSWRAASLHSTDIMQPGPVPVSSILSIQAQVQQVAVHILGVQEETQRLPIKLFWCRETF